MSLHRIGRRAQGKKYEEYLAVCRAQKKAELSWRAKRKGSWACSFEWDKQRGKWNCVPIKRSER